MRLVINDQTIPPPEPDSIPDSPSPDLSSPEAGYIPDESFPEAGSIPDEYSPEADSIKNKLIKIKLRITVNNQYIIVMDKERLRKGALPRYLATYKKLEGIFASIEFQN